MDVHIVTSQVWVLISSLDLQNVTSSEDNGKKPYSCWGFFTGENCNLFELHAPSS